MKNLGDYHDLYVQADTLQLADIFKNFRKMSKHISGRSCIFCISTWPSMGGMFKKDKGKIKVINRCSYATDV